MRGTRHTPTRRDRLWAAIRQRKTFTQAEIAADTGAARWDLQRLVQALVRSGHLRAAATAKPGRPASYELLRDTGLRTPIIRHDGRVYDPNLGELFTPGEEGGSPALPAYNRGLRRAWQAMRVFGTFDAFRIATAAEISYDMARRYLHRLSKAGYVQLVRKAIPYRPGSYHTYQLIRDTGPDAPLCSRRGGQVYDPNLNQVFGPGAEPEVGGK